MLLNLCIKLPKTNLTEDPRIENWTVLPATMIFGTSVFGLGGFIGQIVM